MLPEWTSQQRAALQVMGIPVWEKKSAPAPVFYYRLGSLYLRGQNELPVSLPGWFDDLCLYLGQRPVAIKAPSKTPDLCFDYTDSLNGSFPVETKKSLWQQLAHAKL